MNCLGDSGDIHTHAEVIRRQEIKRNVLDVAPDGLKDLVKIDGKGRVKRKDY